MTKTATKKMDVAGKTQHGRIQGAMWKHLQEDGKTRYTIAISRSYKDKEDEKWKNVHYFDRKDLDDIRSICHVAEEEILRADGMEMTVTED